MELRKKPYTIGDVFDLVVKILKQNGEYPEILDYSLGTKDNIPFDMMEFELATRLDFGGSEGIYLDVAVVFEEADDGKRRVYNMGTFKTLRDDKAAMATMGKLLGDFIYTTREFVRENSLDFEWHDYIVVCEKEGVRMNPIFFSSAESSAIKRKDACLESTNCDKVIIYSPTNRDGTSYVKNMSEENREE